jgi:hypothetical protein
MVQFSNFLCTVNVEEVPLKEYTDPDDDAAILGDSPPTKIVYIQSEEGKPFSIGFRVIHSVGIVPAANSVAWNLELDGLPIQAGFLSYIGGMNSSLRCNRYKDDEGRWLQRDFLFSKLDVREDGPKPDLKEDTSSLGEITLRIRRYQALTAASRPSNGTEYNDFKKADSLHEKQLKGRDISHTIG